MAWTAPRTYTDGELITKAILDVHIRDNLNMIQSFCKIKASDQTVNNSTVLVNDADFIFPVLANEKWSVTLNVKLDTATTPDWKFNWTVPAACTYNHAWIYNNPTAIGNWVSTDGGIVSDGSTGQPVVVLAYFLVGANAGNVQFQWAQLTANASNTIVRAGSSLIARRAQ